MNTKATTNWVLKVPPEIFTYQSRMPVCVEKTQELKSLLLSVEPVNCQFNGIAVVESQLLTVSLSTNDGRFTSKNNCGLFAVEAEPAIERLFQMNTNTITSPTKDTSPDPTYPGYMVPPNDSCGSKLAVNDNSSSSSAPTSKTKRLSLRLFELVSRYTVPPNDSGGPELAVNDNFSSNSAPSGKTNRLSLPPIDLASTCQLPVATQAQLLRLAKKLSACDAAYFTDGNRCCQPICPRCQRTAAIQQRRRVDTLMVGGSPRKFCLLTVTLATDDLKFGHQVFQTSMQKLKRRKLWRDAITGGVIQMDFKASEDGYTRKWNVHCHAILEYSELLDERGIGIIWSEYLSVFGLVGSVDVRKIRIADHPKPFNPVSFYVTRRTRGNLLDLDDTRLIELILFLRKRRIISVFGSWRARKKTPATQRITSDQWASACARVANTNSGLPRLKNGARR